MKILNIHGYRGNSENSAYKILEEMKHETISPSINYDDQKPEETFNTLYEIAIINQIDMIVGTSLGGFYAGVICAKGGFKSILINPCLMPFLHLPRLGCNCDIKEYMRLFAVLTMIDAQNTSTIVGACDEVIDSHDFTKNLLFNERYTVIREGKHSGSTLPLKEYFTTILKTTSTVYK